MSSQGVRSSESIGFEDAARGRDGKSLAVRQRNGNSKNKFSPTFPLNENLQSFDSAVRKIILNASLQSQIHSKEIHIQNQWDR